MSKYLDEASGQCDICKALDEAPHVPILGTFAAPAFDGKLQVGLPFFNDAIAPHAMGVFPKYSLLMPTRSKNPQEGRDVFSHRAWK